ncbi:MAG: type II toxin-antitoxin system RelE/ParE family toxin [Patescibacteria group bacterium]
MIQSFRDKETVHLFHRERAKTIPPDIQRTALRKLWMIDAAQDLNDLKVPPANHLEKLRGKRAGQYSIRINDQWRICFRWKAGNACDVEITDYH